MSNHHSDRLSTMADGIECIDIDVEKLSQLSERISTAADVIECIDAEQLTQDSETISSMVDDVEMSNHHSDRLSTMADGIECIDIDVEKLPQLSERISTVTDIIDCIDVEKLPERSDSMTSDDLLKCHCCGRTYCNEEQLMKHLMENPG